MRGTGTGDHLADPIDPIAFLTRLARHFAAWNRSFERTGFTTVRAVWMARAARLGQVVTARTAKQSVSGIFETVDDSGALVLRDDNRRHLITAADIFFEGAEDAYASGD